MSQKKKEEQKSEKKETNWRTYFDYIAWGLIIIILITYGIKAYDSQEMKKEIKELQELGFINADGTPNCNSFELYKPLKNNEMYKQGVLICEKKKKETTNLFQQIN